MVPHDPLDARRSTLVCAALWLAASALSPSTARADAPTDPRALGLLQHAVLVLDPALEDEAREALLEEAAKLRTLVDPLPPPALGPALPSERLTNVHRALQSARAAAEEAGWADCVRAAGNGLAESSAILEDLGDVGVVRDLHLQIGVCLVLSSVDGGAPEGVASARPHFEMATLTEEAEPTAGLFRAEAEGVLRAVRDEVLTRAKGEVLIETEPPGATVLLDGRELPGVTPLRANVRLGEHFITARRFRFAPTTELRFFQPSATVRIALEAPRRAELGAALAREGATAAPLERQLAEAAWSRADELLVSARDATGLALSLYDASSGKLLRAEHTADLGREGLRVALCRVLGEPCAPPDEGDAVPWYVWPIIGVAVAGAIVTTAVIAETSRDVILCPRDGC